MINFFFSSSYTDMNIHEDTSTEDENNMEKKKKKKMKFEAKGFHCEAWKLPWN